MANYKIVGEKRMRLISWELLNLFTILSKRVLGNETVHILSLVELRHESHLNSVAFRFFYKRVRQKSVYRCRPVSDIALSLSALNVALSITACLTNV